jgi:hypothetical protein
MRPTVNIIVLISFSIILFVIGCEESRLDNLERRLNAFRNILPEELKDKFDSGEYQGVVDGLDSLLSSDLNLKRDYEKIKDKEAINVFSSQEVVDYFREYFVEEIENLKEKKELEDL